MSGSLQGRAAAAAPLRATRTPAHAWATRPPIRPRFCRAAAPPAPAAPCPHARPGARPAPWRAAAEPPGAAPAPGGGATAGAAAHSALSAAPAAAGWSYASALSRRVNLDLALSEAAGAALAGCGASEPEIAFVFASSAYGRSLDLLVPMLRRLLPTVTHIVGCTGFGVSGAPAEGGGGAEEVEHAPAVSLALARFPGVEAALAHVQAPDVPDGDAAPDDWARLIGLPLDGGTPAAAGGESSSGGGAPSTNFVVISDPSFTRIEELLAGLDYAYPGAPVCGGLTSSGRLGSARSTFCWSADKDEGDSTGVKRTGAAVLALRGPITFDLMIAQGCRPLSRHTYTVAAVSPEQRNLVTSLVDARSGATFAPLEALRRDLGDPLRPIGGESDLAQVVSNLCCGLKPPDDMLGALTFTAAAAAAAAGGPAAGGAGPAAAGGDAAAEEAAGTEFLIRGMALTNTGALAVGDTPRLGARLRFMVRDADGARADLAAHGLAYKRRQLGASLAGRPEPPAVGALVFSCNGRGSGLYGEEGYDSRQVGAYVGVPLAGFQCNGEIGSVGGSTKLHGFTAATAVIRAGVKRPGGGGGGDDGVQQPSSESGGGGGASEAAFDHLINQGQQQALGDLFASDAEVHHPKGVTKGAGSLVDYFIACRPMAQGNRHLTLNILLHDIDAAAAAGAGEPGAPPPRRTARASSYRLLHRASNPPALLASGTIEDEFVMEEGGGWRFARRRFVMDPPAAPPAQ
ncbi:MAG: FIST N domain-containing protein [Monoraphidium minutum]|nr:MAG: FIST N domain-containing protein [Monoraphidium minutum]